MMGIRNFDSADRLERAQTLTHFYEHMVFPTLLARLKAVIVDFLIIMLIFSTTSVIIATLNGVDTWVRVLVFIFSIYLYEPLFVSLFGGTIGHMITGIRVKDIDNPNKKINILRASFRFIIKYLLGWLSFLTVTGNDKKRAIHDLFSKSVVLYRNSD